MHYLKRLDAASVARVLKQILFLFVCLFVKKYSQIVNRDSICFVLIVCEFDIANAIDLNNMMD